MFEYALFAAILLMTVSGAFLYQAIAHDPALSVFTTYLIAAYVVFLALAFGQLNALRRGGAVPLDRGRRPRRLSMPKPAPGQDCS